MSAHVQDRLTIFNGKERRENTLWRYLADWAEKTALTKRAAGSGLGQRVHAQQLALRYRSMT